MKKAIYLFFLILISTSFSVLAVSIIQRDEFLKDSENVRNSIIMGGNMNNLRLSLRMMTTTIKIDTPNADENFLFFQTKVQVYL